MEAGADFRRLDTWLWHARLAKSKPLCGARVEAGGFRLNRQPVTKAHARIRVGDVLTFGWDGPGGVEVRVWRVLALGDRRGPPAEARALYEEVREGADVTRAQL
ncbi:RNA-binding S4 domain-containing protein [Roseococcus sp. SYP-B2431]|uniref:S4 domain-containing protein n=1 Tax=Roseococcus sp. SYP-B2431 TaxID=2496640 RepID=UPI001038B47A|nr:S4 domain-containing protein [Roseococcus sp. SYP-B2431]TCH96761.1 RNA-binding S4 domain-containing protein [Roseococcus sp. SYP-B2431]